MTTPERPSGEDAWSQATWEGASLETLRQGARLSMAEKLAWIERMTEPGPSPTRRMQRRSGEAVAEALNRRNVRYLVAGVARSTP